jgi:phytanoyl-CoA hydroxylase
MTIAEQKALFDDQGYLIVKDLLSPKLVAECQSEIKRLHEHYFELKAANEALDDFQIEPFSDKESENGVPILRKIEETYRYSDTFQNLPAHPNLVAMLNAMLGPDLLLFRSTLMLKPPYHGSTHGFHQDSAYWPMDPPTQVTVSIALTDATAENGCIRVIPGSHKWEVKHWGDIWRADNTGMTDDDEADLSGQIEAPLKAGSALFFHSRIVHGSGANKSPHPRNTALYAYFPPNVRYTPEIMPGSPMEQTYRVISGVDGKKEMTFAAA